MSWRSKIRRTDELYSRAKKSISAGNSLLSKRREMFAPEQWPAYFDSAKGISVIDVNGNEFRDFSHFSVGTNTLGYGHDVVDNAVRECINKGNMCTLNPPEEVFLAEKLVAMHPWSSMAKFARTGGEANAIAVRIARAHTGKSKIAFCGYHGWHDWYLSANLEDSGNLDKQLLSGLSARGVPRELMSTSEPFTEGDLKALEAILVGGDVAAIKMEVRRSKEPSIQYLKEVRKLADKHQCMLIFDECTSGFRETFGGLHLKYGIDPDIIILGKTLGNGYAITSILGTKSVMLSAENSFISSTFFTERIGFVAALAALGEMERTKSWEVISEKGAAFKSRLKALAAHHSITVDVGGMDALVTYSFRYNDAAETKTYITQEMLKENFLSSNQFYPSIQHSDNDMKDFFISLDKVLLKLSKIIHGCEDLKKYIDGPVAHSTFQRLN